MRILVISAALLLGACSTYQATEEVNAGPEFTEEEKAAMSTEEKVEVYNAQVTDEKDEIVCRRRATTGSHMRRTTCKTRWEMKREREAAQETLERSKGYTYRPTN